MKLTKDIGIFFKDFDLGKEMFKRIMNDIPIEWIISIKKDDDNKIYSLIYGDNYYPSTIIMREASCSVGRMKRFDKIFIQDTVDSKIREEAIMPTLSQKLIYTFNEDDIRMGKLAD